MSDFERIVHIRPAYDCLMVQPCVHGSKECGTNPGATHGRHNAEMTMTVRNAVAEVSLTLGTGWELPETPDAVSISKLSRPPQGYFVEFHSSVPRYEGHEAQGSKCERWATCYGDIGYTMADEPAALLVRKGSDAVWEWLENLHAESFPAVTS